MTTTCVPTFIPAMLWLSEAMNPSWAEAQTYTVKHLSPRWERLLADYQENFFLFPDRVTPQPPLQLGMAM